MRWFWLLALLTFVPASTSAQDSFSRLPDGRIVFEIKGERIAMPPHDPSPWKGPLYRLGDKFFWLGDLLKSPEETKRLFQSSDSISISLESLAGWETIGGGDFKEYEALHIKIGIVIGARQDSCLSWTSVFSKYRAQIDPAASLFARHTFQHHFPDGKARPETIHVQRSDPPGLPPHFTSYACHPLGYCFTQICMNDKVQIYYKFGSKFFSTDDERNQAMERSAKILRYITLDKYPPR